MYLTKWWWGQRMTLGWVLEMLLSSGSFRPKDGNGFPGCITIPGCSLNSAHTSLYIVPYSNSLQLILLSVYFLLHLNKYRFFDTVAQSPPGTQGSLRQGELKPERRQLLGMHLGFAGC